MPFIILNPAFRPSQSQCDQYIWNGQTYTESGEYTYTTPNSVGCDSVVYLSLIVNYLSSSSSTVEICNEYQWNGELYTESGEYSYSTINQYGCDSTANLSLTIINCGCTDPNASNYDPTANTDDGSCLYYDLTTVTGAGNATGGNVVFTSGNIPTATETVVLRRNTTFIRKARLICNKYRSSELELVCWIEGFYKWTISP